MKPIHTLLFILGVFLLLALAMSFSPKEGVKIGAFTWQMPTFGEMFFEEKEGYADLSTIINQQFEIDSLVDLEIEDDSVVEVIRRANYDSLAQSISKLEMDTLGRRNLNRFFARLKKDTLVRIMHYGDSQIEGDRITAFVRNKLQMRFGGTGPGLRPAVQPYDFIFSARQMHSDNWKRFPIYGNVDTTIMHHRYGVMGAFARYTPPVNDSVVSSDSTIYNAWLSVSKTKISYRRTQQYEYMRLFYGNAKSPVKTVVQTGTDTLLSATLPENINFGVLEWDLPDSTSDITLQFSGCDSPDIYGIELASRKGIIMDNIALRGCSGTIFTKANYTHSLKMYKSLNPSLFILQFGGNVVPYIYDRKAIKRYGHWFGRQIERLQSLCPGAAILVIGPSDMSTKEKDKYVTYGHLPAVVEELKKVSFQNGVAYWDMYKAMGGRNSMPSWVNARLAGPDYVHFSAKGARLVANMFYNALIYEYNNYLEGKGK